MTPFTGSVLSSQAHGDRKWVHGGWGQGRGRGAALDEYSAPSREDEDVRGQREGASEEHSDGVKCPPEFCTLNRLLLCDVNFTSINWFLKCTGKNTRLKKYSFPSVNTKSWLQGRGFESSKKKKKKHRILEEDIENHDRS